MKCNKCHGRGWIFHHEAVHFAAACPCDACVCAVCDGDAYEFTRSDSGAIFSQPCSGCSAQRLRARMYSNARIPKKHADSMFGNFEPANASQRNAANWFLERVDTWTPGEKALILSGPVGTGKTHLMCAWLRSITLRHGVGAKFVEFSHLLRDIKAGYDQNKSDAEIISRLVDIPVLVIDELGKQLDTDWQKGILDQLISQRYNKKNSTFATTNYPLEMGVGRMVSRASDDFKVRSLSEVVGSRMASRLAEMCDVIEVDAPDYRRQKACI